MPLSFRVNRILGVLDHENKPCLPASTLRCIFSALFPTCIYVPIQNKALPNTILTQRCCPRLHAMLYRYFGEKTVQMNKCVLNIVHARMTKNMLAAVKVVRSVRWHARMLRRSARCCWRSKRFVADVHQSGPDQLLTNARSPTAATL